MTHNAARISAATHPEIGAAYFISQCSYSCCFHSRLICLLFSCCTVDCVQSFWAASMKNVCCQHSVSHGQWLPKFCFELFYNGSQGIKPDEMEQLCWAYSQIHTHREHNEKETAVKDRRDFRVFHFFEHWKDVVLGTHAVIKGETQDIKLCCPPAVFSRINH